MRRKKRRGEVICRCGAYRFPHRQLGGACTGGAFVQRVFETQLWGACRGCHLLEERSGEMVCQALDGREVIQECPELQEHIRFHEIPLYGVNRRADQRVTKRRR